MLQVLLKESEIINIYNYMDYSKIVPQSLLILFFTYMLVTALKDYQKTKTPKTAANFNNLIIGLAFMLLMLLWGGFFTPINQW